MQEFRCARCMKKIDEGAVFCEHCGYDQRNPQPENALRRFSVLRGRYLVGDMIGKGGFGLTYVGMDLTLEMKVAIKEYYPSGAATRLHSYSNDVRWDTSDAEWNKERDHNISRFLREARRMAQLDEVPGVVRVRDTFRENGTAYIVMDFVEGDTLKKWLPAHGPMNWDQCRDMLMPIVDSLAVIHDNGFIHRDIAPDNIMIRPNGTARLLDMGAAVDTSANNGHASMVVVKNNFSAPEQYDQNAVLGSWTDVYEMSATIYYCLTGTLMPSAVDRIMRRQPIVFPPERNVPPTVAQALIAGMEMEPERRIRDMRELKNRLLGIAGRNNGAGPGAAYGGANRADNWSDQLRRWADIQKAREESSSVPEYQRAGSTPQNQNGRQGARVISENDVGETMPLNRDSRQDIGETMPLSQNSWQNGRGMTGNNAGETMPLSPDSRQDIGETMPLNQDNWQDAGTMSVNIGETMPVNGGTTMPQNPDSRKKMDTAGNAPGGSDLPAENASEREDAEKWRNLRKKAPLWMDACVLTAVTAFSFAGLCILPALGSRYGYFFWPIISMGILSAVLGVVYISRAEKAQKNVGQPQKADGNILFYVCTILSMGCLAILFFLSITDYGIDAIYQWAINYGGFALIDFLHFFLGFRTLSVLAMGIWYLLCRNRIRKGKNGKWTRRGRTWSGVLVALSSAAGYGNLWIMVQYSNDLRSVEMFWPVVYPLVLLIFAILTGVLRKENLFKKACRRILQAMLLIMGLMLLSYIMWGQEWYFAVNTGVFW